MGLLSADTSAEAEEVMLGILRGKSSLQRLKLLERATLDTWELVKLSGEPLKRWLGEEYPPDLGWRGALSMSAMEEAVRLKRSFNLIHLQTGFKIDIFVSEDRPFDRERVKRGIFLEVDGQVVRVSTAEDTILAKLEWDRAAVSERHWRDILGVLLVQGFKLDRGYLRYWARELGLSEALEKALSLTDQEQRHPTSGAEESTDRAE